MSFNFKQHNQDLLFIPLGGTSEIGMNIYVYAYQGKLLIVDCGCGFADETLPGIDLMIPDVTFLHKHKKDIVGIVLTHAHEDHIGAIMHVWDKFECDIYATAFVGALLHTKFRENSYKMPGKILNIDLDKPRFNLGPFDLEMVHLCHSVLEMHAILFRTPKGNIFHTGDWKYDKDPMIGPVNDEQKLKEYGDEGILAITADSTNVFNPLSSGSEGELRPSLAKLVAECQRMVVVTTFSSNIVRIESIIEAAVKSGRKIVLAGKNLRRIFQAAKDSGYLQSMDESIFVSEKEASKLKRKEILIIATGCQGEPMAAVTKMANREHKFINLESGDTVIFSSKVIPGNDHKIYRVYEKLLKRDIDVRMEKTDFTHVSGHPGQEELKRLYALLRPKILIPVHGERIHLHYHKKLALKWGIKKVQMVSDGDVIRFENSSSNKVGEVQVGALGLYGNLRYTSESSVIKTRLKLSSDGMCLVILNLSNTRELLSAPMISTPGYLDEAEARDFLVYLQDEISDILSSKRWMKISFAEIKSIIHEKVKTILKHNVDRVALIKVIIVTEN